MIRFFIIVKDNCIFDFVSLESSSYDISPVFVSIWILNLSERSITDSFKNLDIPLDASDALAIALCHYQQFKINELW